MFRRVQIPDRLVVGLGNPGREYSRSRHNAGFLVVDALAKKHGLRFSHRWAQAHVAVGTVDGVTVALAKPLTYMNLSGDSVRALLRKLALEPDRLLVVTDDIDMPLGRIRLRERGSSGGHRGVQSIVDRLGTDAFARLKVGVGRPDPRDAADYVLAEFSPSESEEFARVIERAVEAVGTTLSNSVAVAMNGTTGSDEPRSEIAEVNGKLVLLLGDSLGRGDESLGHVLLANFLRALGAREGKPAAIVLVNSAVRLACAGAEAFEAQEHLRELDRAGVPVYACRTCLEAFGLVDRVEIGQIGGMPQFVEMMDRHEVIAL